MQRNKRAVVLLVGMLVLGMLASFSVVASAGGKVSGKLTIWSWGAGAEKEAREKAVEAFAKAHPELEIEHAVIPTADSVWDQKQAAAYAAGTAADVMQMSPDYYGLLTEYYEDLNSYVERDGINLDEVVTTGMLDGYYRPNGKLEALPLLANCFVFAYNKEMFDKFGVEYPTDDWTWEDFAAMAPKFVSGKGFDRTYFMVNHWVMGNFALISKGGVPYSDDFKTALVDSKEVAAGLDLFAHLIDIGAIPSDVAAKSMPREQLFVSGKAAIYPMGGFEIGALAEEIGDAFEWDAVLPPKISATGKNSNITYATGYAMNKDAKNKEAAWLFLKEVSFANDDMAKITALVGMPANKKIANDYYADIMHGNVPNEKYVEGLATSRINPWGGVLATAGDHWGQMWEAVTIGGMSGAEAQEKYFPLIQQAFKELNIEN
jgi:multiple sugar transport system substrate-binding protein